MPDIDIHRSHALGAARAREVVEATAQRMREKFGMHTAWQGDELQFKRSGVEGRIAVGEDSLHVTARLGLMLAPLRSMIEQEITRSLDKHFA